MIRPAFLGGVLCAFACVTRAKEKAMRAFIGQHCAECHDEVEEKGGSDLVAL